MIKFFNSTALTASIVSILHLLSADLVWAEAQMDAQEAFDAANSSLFMPDVSDLYSDQGTGSFTPVDSSTTVSPAELYGGVEPVSPSENSLDSAIDYEGLYGGRDDELQNLEEGSGLFVNGEDNAFEVLNGSVGVTTLRDSPFLDLSYETLLSETASEEFGSCVSRVVTGETEGAYEDYETSYCHTSNFTIPDFSANRRYYEPEREPTFEISASGEKRCIVSGQNFEVDGARTCGQMAAFKTIPNDITFVEQCEASTANRGCVAFKFENSNGLIEDSISMFDRMVVNRADFTFETEGEELSVIINDIERTATNTLSFDELEASPTSEHFFSFQKGSSANLEPVYWGFNGLDEKFTNAQIITYQVPGGPVQFNPYIGFNPLSWNDPYDDELYTGAVSFGFWVEMDEPVTADNYTRFISEGFGFTVRAVTAPMDTNIEDGDHLVTTGFTHTRSYQHNGATWEKYAATVFRDTTGVTALNATLQVEFSAKHFTNFTFSREDLANVNELWSSGACTVDVVPTEHASTKNGVCVDDADGIVPISVRQEVDGWQLGQTLSTKVNVVRCNGGVPFSPFARFLNGNRQKRTATKLDLVLNCPEIESFETTNTCLPYEENDRCTLVATTCADESTSGPCRIYEQEWSCGTTTTYVSPVVSEVNVCESDLSCLDGSCFPNTSTSGSESLAEVAAQLSAAEIMAGDMVCTENTITEASDGSDSCTIFNGDQAKCKQIALGLANCCKSADGVSPADYIQLTLALSRLNSSLTAAGTTNLFTSAWTGLETLAGDTFSTLTGPLVEVWDSVIGNSGVAGSMGSSGISAAVAGLQQSMMNNAAQWVANVFGEQAANAIFSSVTGGAAVGGGQLLGDVAFSASASSFISMVTTAYTIYIVATLLIEILFACNDEEKELSVKKAIKATHKVGRYCSKRFLGACVEHKESYCEFSSPLSRIMNEQIRIQLGTGWGSARSPNCQGFTVAQLREVDFDDFDLSEWTGMLATSGVLDVASVNIDNLTGATSTLGEAADGEYVRENAIERSDGRFGNVNVDSVRDEAARDFGASIYD